MRGFLIRHRKFALLFSILLTIIVILLIASVLFIGNRNKVSTKDIKQSNKELQTIEEKFKNVEIENRDNYKEYDAALKAFKSYYESGGEKARFDYLRVLSLNLTSLYSLTNAPELYELINKDLSSYAKREFPDLYIEDKYFSYPCSDPKCAEKAQPEKALLIIENVKKSDFPEEIKENIIQDLLNAGYRSEKDNDHSLGKVTQYLLIADSIRSLSEYTKTGANTTISQEIVEFIKSDYPEEYAVFKNNDSELLK